MTVTAPRETYVDREPIVVSTHERRPIIPIPAHRPRMAALDGVRGLAILSVMVFHVAGPIVGSRLHLRQLWRLFYSGWVGVDLFFVLSGFLITGILLDSKESPGYFRRFYLRRALRIFPLYYGILAIVFGIVPLFEPRSAMGSWMQAHQMWFWLYGSNVLTALSHRFMTTSWHEVAHLWSLAVEEHFYLFWPVVVFLLSRRGMVRAAIGLIALSLVCRVVLYRYVGGEGVYELTPCRLDGLLAGALLALAWRDDQSRRYLWRWSRPVLAASLIALVFLFRHRELQPYDRYTQLFGYPFITLAAAAFLSTAVATRSEAPLGRALGGRFLGFLGRYSYGLYLFHVLLRPLFIRLLDHLTARGTAYPLACAIYIAVSVAASALIAVVSYHAYERRFLQLKDRWAAA